MLEIILQDVILAQAKFFNTCSLNLISFKCRTELPAPSSPWVRWLPRRYAGHSKWNNIRHIKGAKDQQKSLTAMRMARDIRQAVKGNIFYLNSDSHP